MALTNEQKDRLRTKMTSEQKQIWKPFFDQVMEVTKFAQENHIDPFSSCLAGVITIRARLILMSNEKADGALEGWLHWWQQILDPSNDLAEMMASIKNPPPPPS